MGLDVVVLKTSSILMLSNKNARQVLSSQSTLSYGFLIGSMDGAGLTTTLIHDLGRIYMLSSRFFNCSPQECLKATMAYVVATLATFSRGHARLQCLPDTTHASSITQS